MSRVLELEIVLHPNQSKVRKDRSRFRVLVAGRRFGKTTLAIDELIEHALQSEKPCWYVAPTYKQAKMVAWHMLLSKLPRELISKKNEVDLTVEMITGAPISLKGADNEDSLRGVGLSFVVLDEVAQMKPNVWQEIIRPMLTDTKGGALFIGTPKGKNTLYELYQKGQRKEDDCASYLFGTVDNPFIDPVEVDIARKELSERYFKQEYEASFEEYTGLIWPEFGNRHIIESVKLEDYFETVGAIDPAMSGTTGVLYATIGLDGVIYITDEYYEQDKRASEVSAVIRGKSKSWVIDPASKIRSQAKVGQLYSMFDEYAENGIICMAAENDVDAGINRVAEYFKADKIKIFSRCKNLIYELERYHWSEEREGVSGVMKPAPYKHLDHLCDCLRYIVMSRPQRTVEPEKPILRGSVAWEMLQDELEAKDWRGKYK